MKFLRKVFFITLFLIIIIFIIGIIIKKYEQKKYVEFYAKVIKVIDGDTVIIKGNKLVRLLGIDAPELHHPDYPVQKYAKEVKKYLEKRVKNKICKFVYNKHNKYDRYGRILAYMYLDNKLINAELVKKGYAFVYRKKECEKTKDFLILEKIARDFKRGVWKYY